jgi:hypothetical protein
MKYDFEPYVKPGKYQVVYFGHRFETKFGRPTLMLQFTIAELTEYENAILTKYFPIKRFNQKGGFSVTKKQQFAKFWLSVFPEHDCSRMDRFPLSKLNGLILKAKVEAGTHDFEQKEIPKQLQVSKIVSLAPF